MQFISTIDPDLENGTSFFIRILGERGMEKYQMLSAGEDGKLFLRRMFFWSFEEDLGKRVMECMGISCFIKYVL